MGLEAASFGIQPGFQDCNQEDRQAMTERCCRLMIIHIFKTKVFSLHLIKQEIELELDARSWFFTYF